MKDKKKLILIVGGSVIALIAIAVVVYFAAFYNKSYRIIKLEDYSGSVEVLRRNNPIDLFNGLQLVSGDSSAIGDDSLMLLLIDSDKHMMVSENTKFNIRATGTDESGKVVIDITDGRASFAIDNKLGEESTFEVHTPNATTSIRGTVFTVSYEPSTNQTVVAVDEGTVNIEYGDGKEFILNEDGIAYITGDNADVSKDDLLYFFYLDYGPHPWYCKYIVNDSKHDNGIGPKMSDDTIKELYNDIMTNHKTDIDAYVKELNDPIQEAYAETGATQDEWLEIYRTKMEKNVTHWFPEEFVMDVGDGYKKYRIDAVRLVVIAVNYDQGVESKKPNYIDIEGKQWGNLDPQLSIYIHEVENG